ncbi:hypothetical protein [Eudoraea adriatica]|uniref:hypothetical protein n=1 Tax=Eudoraea adriatica TaxID=446681 RepID=UPI00036E5F39|nr:hypothetical protein [Eudoraea adriatica]
MLKFFRRIRQQLLTQNKLSKYLLYAIGEIILVVIGILIALQINNWNQDRIRKQEEFNILKAIKIGLEKDKRDILYNTKRINSSISSANKVIYALENELPYNDSIAICLGDLMFPVMFVHSTSAFETLKSKGIDLIKNTELREKIIDVYDAGYTFFLKNEVLVLDEAERGLKDVFSTRFHEAYVYGLDKPGYEPKLTPLNYNALKYDQEFIYFLKTYKNRLNILLNFHYRGRLQRDVEILTESVNNEIVDLKE